MIVHPAHWRRAQLVLSPDPAGCSRRFPWQPERPCRRRALRGFVTCSSTASRR